MLKLAMCLLPVLGLLCIAGQARSETDAGMDKLKAAQSKFRVCAAPDNLPFTNSAGEGFDNKIAAFLAKAEEKPLEYYWWPLRRGFIGYTLGRWNCDVVLGVPAGYELTETTKPYYCSTYVEVKLTNPERNSLGNPVGVVVSTPPLDILLRRNLNPIVYLPNDATSPNFSDNLLPDLLSGRISAAYVWGPVAGYLASQAPGKVTISPLQMTAKEQDIRIKFPMSVGVRHGDHARVASLNSTIEKNKSQIKDILVNANVPLVDDPVQCAAPQHQALAQPPVLPAAIANDQTTPPQLIKIADTLPASPTPAGNNNITCNGPLTMDEVAKISDGSPSPSAAHPYTVKDGKVDDKTYLGWIRFAVSCQQCHGAGGTGSAIAPDLTQALKGLDKKQFETIVTCGLKGNLGTGVMPAWQNNPNVMPYLNDIWAYLKARSDGVIQAGRPQKIAEANGSSSGSPQ